MEINSFKEKNSFINVSNYSNDVRPFWIGKYMNYNLLNWQIDNEDSQDEWLKFMFLYKTNIKKIKLYFSGIQEFDNLVVEKSYDNYESPDTTGWESLFKNDDDTNKNIIPNSDNQIVLNFTAQDFIYLRFKFENAKTLNLVKIDLIGDEYISIDRIIRDFYFKKNQKLMPEIYSSTDIETVLKTFIEKNQE